LASFNTSGAPLCSCPFGVCPGGWPLIRWCLLKEEDGQDWDNASAPDLGWEWLLDSTPLGPEMGFGDRACGSGKGERRRAAKLARTTEKWAGSGEERQRNTCFLHDNLFPMPQKPRFPRQTRAGCNLYCLCCLFHGRMSQSRSGITQLWRRACSPTTLKEEEMGLPCFGGKQALPGKQRGTRKASHVFLCPFFSPTHYQSTHSQARRARRVTF